MSCLKIDTVVQKFLRFKKFLHIVGMDLRGVLSTLVPFETNHAGQDSFWWPASILKTFMFGVTNPILLRLRGPQKVRLRRRTCRLKPSADVNLGMGFSAIVPCPSRIGRFGVPFDNSEVRASALNHEPVSGICGYYSANFTTEFAYRCHGPLLYRF